MRRLPRPAPGRTIRVELAAEHMVAGGAFVLQPVFAHELEIQSVLACAGEQRGR